MATDETQNEDEKTPPAKPTPADAKPKVDDTSDAEQVRAENERLKKALAETTRKSEANRRRLEDIDREKEERENAKLGEAERLRKQLAEKDDELRVRAEREAQLEADLLKRRLDQEIERTAIGMFEHPQLAPSLVDRKRIAYDSETDKFSNVKDALERVIKDFPGLAGAKRGGGSPSAMKFKTNGNGNGSGGNGDHQSSLREEFIRMGNYEAM